MNKTNFTKKIVAAACIFSMGLSVCAENIYPYENKQPQQVDGTVKPTDDSDVIIIVKPKNKNPKGDNYIGSTNITKQEAIIFAGFLAIVASTSIVNAKSSSNKASSITNQRTTSIASSGSVSSTVAVIDPYVVPIDGKYYVMVKDKTEGTWGPEDLLGYTDPKNDKFRSLRALESDKKYAKLTGEEIQKAGVRLVQLNKDGVLLVKERDKDYDLAKINYIDMLNLKVTANGESTGIFGHFNVHLKNTNPKMVTGFVTYDTESKLKILFE